MTAEIFSGTELFMIKFPNVKSIPVLYQWLRDHCRCDECYNATTNQRNITILDFPENIAPSKYDCSEGVLQVTWMGGHKSDYQLSWLLKNAGFIGDDSEEEKIPRIPWQKLPDIARVGLKPYLNNDAGLSSIISSVLRYGIGIVTGVDPTLAATEEVITRIAPVQKTLFGEMWEVNHNGNDADVLENGDLHVFQDTAYTAIALRAHTDNTYWCDAAGLQVFHMLKPAPIGGETLFVDGLSVTLKLKAEHPEAYERLTHTPISATYIADGQHHVYRDPIIKLDPVTKKLLQIRFNLYDRSVMRTVPQNKMKQHYDDLRMIASIVAEKTRENYVKLQPGEVWIVDNWTVLHGRAGYQGSRHLGGSYVSRTDWQSKATVLGLINC
ncbi:trimethyllysine dioxygenase, mitochondrial isoform X2 [Athalia rosae]|uniref:trimethyllysine dioxygenase, mitochondrial isoform X2 n=1 Tax=Athalia rosae TaxID=37344 RepID=UPI0020337CE1|nr:trimethyllysine dioxygenase, mitochondrial isoform X2 [Athalia rosae]